MRGGTRVKIDIKNDTRYELTVRYSGEESKKVVIPKGETQNIDLPPGAYRVAASVSAAQVLNYYGNNTLEPGSYSERFYISSEFGSGPLQLPDGFNYLNAPSRFI
jgi:hypothetical protein